MYCSNCGTLLKDGAKFCYECGERIGSAPEAAYPIERNGRCNITITRDNAFPASLVSMRIYLDGINVGSVSVGKSVFIPCEYGEHSLTIKLNSHQISRLIYVPDETEFYLTVSLMAKPEFSFAPAPTRTAPIQQPYAPPVQQPYTPPVQQQNVYVNNVSHSANEKNKWIAFLLCVFFGMLGFHKFYEGKILAGILYICTLGLCGIGVLIDAIVLLFKPNPYYV